MAADNKTLGRFQLTDIPAATSWYPTNRSNIRHRQERYRILLKPKILELKKNKQSLSNQTQV